MDKERLLRWFKGNQQAVDFVRKFGSALHRADDIVDEESWGVDQRGQQMAKLIYELLFGIGNDPFYLQHKAALTPALLNGLLYWDLSNDLARSPIRETRMFAFVWREVVEQVLPLVAMLCGARYDEARDIALELHRLEHESPVESFDSWEEEVRR